MVIDYVQEKWKRQHGADPGAWIKHYQDSTGLPSRQAVLAGLRHLQPWGSLCELGCHAGPMLGMIAEEFPTAGLTGVEVNPVAAQAAKRNVPQANIALERLQEWLDRDEHVDVIVTHYTLAYVAPESIRPILAQCCRVAKRGLVLAEPMGDEGLIWAFPEWRHDYVRHLTSLGLKDFTGASVEGVGNLNGVLAVRL